jgi:hypothetical protein
MSLCKKLQMIPIAEAIRIDGTVVIIFADGRKMIFNKDDITRILTEPEVVKAPIKGELEDVQQQQPAEIGKPARGRTSRVSVDLLSKSRTSAASASRDAEEKKGS